MGRKKMKEFRVRLFPKESGRPRGLMNAIQNILGGGKLKLRQGDRLDFKIGRATEHGYNCVDIYYKGELIGEIRKSGIDELIDKGALISATYFGYMDDVPQITLNHLEAHEYRNKPEYKVWREKFEKKIAADEEEREKLFPTELNRILKDLSKKTNPIDRHFLLQSIVGETYKRRKDTEMRKICNKIGVKHLSEFKDLAPFLKKEFGGVLPRVTTFQYLSTLLSEDGDYDRAIKICKMAISYGLKDGTSAGFEGRIKKIEKKRPQT
jgi:hypothetical protein